MEVNVLRKKFLDYFAAKNHTIVKSSSLVPHGDATLLFTNAGMNQFKEVFLGLDKRDYVRATSAQKCVRAGGKHNDLENVGYTARHHTFFEMLGNFSFGDYFKLDAIKYAWEFLTEVLLLPKDKLYVTVYHTDDEAYDIWHKTIGLNTDRIIKIGDKASGGSDNFWQMGETGPCGPCTEIFYDHGATIPGGLPGSSDEDGDRYIEIWNCVFMQYNRDENGVLHPLPKPSVDTGMGLERIAAVMQNVHSNYEIDLFVKLINSAKKIVLSNEPESEDSYTATILPSLKVIADHIRSISFLIADGVLPSNEGRGYVLRRIIRRAIRHGYKLQMRAPFLYKIIDTLATEMGEAYPELGQKHALIKSTIETEEVQFLKTIDNGMKMLNGEIIKILKNVEILNGLKDVFGAKSEILACIENEVGDVIDTFPTALNNLSSDKIIQLQTILVQQHLSGDTAFKLYDTYGFPLDLTENVCRDCAITVDLKAFDNAMAKQKNQARESSKFKMDKTLDYTACDTSFSGYTENSIDGKVIAIYKNSESVTELTTGEEGVVVLDKTVFYAESGGQIGDSGIIQIEGGVTCLFKVNDTVKIRPQVFGHVGTLSHGTLSVCDSVTATFDLHKRLSTGRNHSATHLLHRALREVLGEHVVQKGSLVNDQLTRFDFAHTKPMTKAEINEVERIVNYVIMMNYVVSITNTSYDEAVKSGAMALFGEKYTENVRVIKMGEFSNELCGGTHVSNTGEIGLFSIISETGVANGIRRIEAITGEVALHRMQQNLAILDNLRDLLKAQNNDLIVDKVNVALEQGKEQSRQISTLKNKVIAYQVNEIAKNSETLFDGTKFLTLELVDTPNDEMTEIAEQLKSKLGNAIIIIGAKNNDKANIVVGVSKSISGNYNAGKIVAKLAEMLDGRGGGRPELALGGGIKVDALSEVLQKSKLYI